MERFTFLIVFNVGLAVSLAMIPVARHLSFRFGITSIPGGRRQERVSMPKLGGLAIIAGFIAAAIAAHLLPVPRHDPAEGFRLTGLLLGSLFIFVVGIVDDKYDLTYMRAFAAQVFAAGIAIAFQIFIEFVNNPLTGQQTDPWSPVVTVALTTFWLVLMMNTVNLLDGSDGLAAGVALIAAIVLFLNSALRQAPPQISVSLLPLAFAGALFGFLLHNFFPARIYLGGSAWFLGLCPGRAQHHWRRQDGDDSLGHGLALDGPRLASAQSPAQRRQSLSRRSRPPALPSAGHGCILAAADRPRLLHRMRALGISDPGHRQPTLQVHRPGGHAHLHRHRIRRGRACIAPPERLRHVLVESLSVLVIPVFHRFILQFITIRARYALIPHRLLALGGLGRGPSTSLELPLAC